MSKKKNSLGVVMLLDYTLRKGGDMAYEYRINEKDMLVEMNDSWLKFARENWDPRFDPDKIIGHPLWEFIRDETTRHFYQTIVEKLRAGERDEYRIPFRCDSPDMIREMEMVIRKVKGGEIIFESNLKNEIKRNMKAPYRYALDNEPAIRMCSWCKKIFNDETGEWIDLDQAIREMRYFEEGRLPHVTHGICDSCRESLKKSLSSE